MGLVKVPLFSLIGNTEELELLSSDPRKDLISFSVIQGNLSAM